MAELGVEGDTLVLRLSGLEKLAALRGDVRVPARAVRAVSVAAEPWNALRGIRSPGTGIPRVIAYGTRRLTGGKPDFAALRGTGPALQVDLDERADFGRLLVSVRDPGRAVSALRSALTPEAR